MLPGAVGTSLKPQEGHPPHEHAVDYNVNVSRQWNPSAMRDSSVVTHALTARGGIQVMGKHRVDVQSGYDLPGGNSRPPT